MEVKTIGKLLSNSYKDNQARVIDGFSRDDELSGKRAQVYKNDLTGQAYVVHRGTQGIQDVVTDVKLAFGDKSGKRFKHAQKIQNQANEKFGNENITTLGHSLGASIAEKVGKSTGKIITLNKPVNISDSISVKVPMKQIDIKTQNDPVSILRGFQKGKKPTVIKSLSKNPLTEHKVNVINRLIKF